MLGNRTWVDHADAVLLERPVFVEATHEASAVGGLLDRADLHALAGRWVVVTLAYEAASAFGLPCQSLGGGEHLAWSAVYDPESVCFPKRREWAGDRSVGAPSPLEVDTGRAEHAAGVAAIRSWIARGHTYQVNLTVRARLEAAPEPLTWFLSLWESHPTPYGAFVSRAGSEVVSLSPELFLRRRGDVLETRPMKGTCRRGRDACEDALASRALLESAKERAENLMIVDMARNDLGRVAVAGGVTVPELFALERYGTVWQMTSLVRARLRRGVGLREVLAATFPGASVTGAPKVRTMELIRELETTPRGLYCGAIGLLQPGGDSTWSLPIRTLVREDGSWRLGIGSGITWDSQSDAEYDEVLAKALFALGPAAPLRLLETMLRAPCGRVLDLAEHLDRLEASAAYWDHPFDRARAEAVVASAGRADSAVLRLSLSASGELCLEERALPPAPEPPVRVLLVSERTDSGDPALRHKTDRRAAYDRGRERALAAGFSEALFRNEADRVTEGAITNVFALGTGGWRTPPPGDGLLEGIWRRRFAREVGALEATLTIEDLVASERIVLGNSIRGTIEVAELWEETAEGAVRLWERP